MAEPGDKETQLKTEPTIPTHQIPQKEAPVAKKQPILDTLLRKTLSPERAVEFLSAQIMMGVEIMHDQQLYPEKYGFSPNQVGSGLVPQEPAAAKWAFDHIGDIWEISAGHTAMRLGFVAVNEFLKSDFVKERVTKGKEIQIPDEVCFWTSLMTTVTVKAVHSLGYISLFGIHDHMDNPVPGMLFGQGVAAVVLVASHYAAKYREPIKDLALRAARFTGRKFKEFDTMMNDLGRPDITPDLAVNTADKQDSKEVS